MPRMPYLPPPPWQIAPFAPWPVGGKIIAAMPLDPESARDIDRFFTAMKSVNELDKLEVRNVVGGMLNPTDREAFMTMNYHRAAINIELLLTIFDAKQFQVIAMVARATLETAVELGLIAKDPDAARKIHLFTEVEKLRSARKLVAFKKAHPDAKIETAAYEQYIRQNQQRIVQEKERTWPAGQRVTHWSAMNMEGRADFLGNPYDELYQINYSQLSWYVHSGVTGVANLKGDTLGLLCGVAFRIIMESYGLILETIIMEFKLYKHDDKLKNKITLAKMLPFTNTPEEGGAITRVLMG